VYINRATSGRRLSSRTFSLEASMQLRCAMIYAKDMTAMTAFYRDGLGLTPIPERSSDGWLEMDAGGVTVALHAIPPHIAADIVIASPPVAREETPIKLIFEVPDLEAARAFLMAHGAQMMDIRPWGSCDGLDPEGNVFQIVVAS
jgi:catechol 2,3-dioxygenase-like lactoylglutathione lyase family enzyme